MSTGPSPALYPSRMKSGESSQRNPGSPSRKSSILSPSMSPFVGIRQSPAIRPNTNPYANANAENTHSPSLRAVFLDSPRAAATAQAIKKSEPNSSDDHDHVEMDVIYLVHDTPKTPLFFSPLSRPSTTTQQSNSWYRSPRPLPTSDSPAAAIFSSDEYDDIDDDDNNNDGVGIEIDDLILDLGGSAIDADNNAEQISGPQSYENSDSNNPQQQRVTFTMLAQDIATARKNEKEKKIKENNAIAANLPLPNDLKSATNFVIEHVSANVAYDVNDIKIIHDDIRRNDAKRTSVPNISRASILSAETTNSSTLVSGKRRVWFNIKPPTFLKFSKSLSHPELEHQQKNTSGRGKTNGNYAISSGGLTDKQLNSKSSPLPFLALASHLPTSSREKKIEYQQLKILGHGVQGTVSLRLHTLTGSIVALKSISVRSQVDANVRASFRREVDILQATVKHSNIIRLLDFWEGKSKVYQVFEVCSGGDLEGGLPPGLMNEDEGIRLIAPILDAVRFLHALGILHRDIRPANILFRRPISGHESLHELMSIPVLADFGIATYEKFSGRMGSDFPIRPPHIAPEVVDGGRFRKPSDMFGVGVCLIRILMGRPIVLEDQNYRLLSGEPGWINLSNEGRQFLRRILEPVPEKRLSALDALNSDWFRLWNIQIFGPVVED
ncbi:Calcium-dependent protein kinase 5 [Physocladia obscura]|uniref:non-specific serine/threonine protein kinase n=1 Tax=Physocladia obscura TaxID=109957 RepID=A0AAD5T7E9_9FUNG|nr:Calcium-dependent protein kinase 5 [Physocladia obscura]